MYILKISMEDGFFDAPVDLFKEKQLLSQCSESVYFLCTKKSKNGSNHSILQKTVFYKQVLEVHRPSTFLCQISGALKSLVPNPEPVTHSGSQNNTAYIYLYTGTVLKHLNSLIQIRDP